MSRPAHHPMTDEAGTTGGVRAPRSGGDGASVHAARPDAGAGERAPGVLRRLGRRIERAAAVDAATCAAYLAFAAWLFHGLWPTPATRAIADNVNDQALIEWFLAHGVLLWTGDFSLVTDRLNAPDGVNLMSNASHILHGVLMAPITAAFGAHVSFAVLASVNLAATAAGWYLLLARGLGLHRAAAIIGGAVAGFAPGMISQSNSHLHMTAQWLVPPIVWCVIKLTRAGTTRGVISAGAALGLLVTAQVFLGEEVLFLTALTMLLFATAYAVRRRAWARQIARPFAAGMLVAAVIAVVLLAYPLLVQFFGRQHTPNAPFRPGHYYADVASFVLFSPLSIAGSEDAGRLATSSAEYNTYLGLPLILVVIGVVIWRRRSPVMVAAGTAGLIMTLLSFGPHVTVNGERIGWPSLYGLINDAPVISGALPTRYALALIPLIAVMLAYAVDAALRTGGFPRWAVPAAAVAALLPTAPMPLATTDRDPVPTFISSGAWRQCTPEGGVLVPVPLPTPRQPDLMRWPAAANAAFSIPEGFFIGPYGPGGRSSLGTWPQPTSRLLTGIAASGQVPPIGPAEQQQARRDLDFWNADCVALAQVPHEGSLKTALEQLLGPGTRIRDTWTWKVDR